MLSAREEYPEKIKFRDKDVKYFRYTKPEIGKIRKKGNGVKSNLES